MTPNPHAADFIEVYHDALDAATCRAIVARFDASRQDQAEGELGPQVGIKVHGRILPKSRGSAASRRGMASAESILGGPLPALPGQAAPASWLRW